MHFMRDRVVEEPPYPRENYVHHNAITRMALVDHWVSSSLRIHPQNGTVGETSLFLFIGCVWVRPLRIFFTSSHKIRIILNANLAHLKKFLGKAFF